MHGHWTKPPEVRKRMRFLTALAVFAVFAAPEFATVAAAAPAMAEDGYRPLVLAGNADPAPIRMFPAGIYSHRPGPETGLTIRANWRKLTIPAGANGHFYVTARVKKRPPSYSLVDITFLVDTGASLVALTRSDAEKLGFDMRELEFTGVSQTANGEVRFAAVTLPELRVDSLKVKDLPAAVVDGNLEISLLGNSFLSRLKSYQVANEELVLRW